MSLHRLLWMATVVLSVLLLASLWEVIQETPSEPSRADFDGKRLPDGRLLMVWTDFGHSRQEVRAAFVEGKGKVTDSILLGEGRYPRIGFDGNETFVVWWTQQSPQIEMRIARVEGQTIQEIGGITPEKSDWFAATMVFDSNGTFHLAYFNGERIYWEGYNHELRRRGIVSFVSTGSMVVPRFFYWPNGSVDLLLVSQSETDLYVELVEYNKGQLTRTNLSQRFTNLFQGRFRDARVTGLPSGGIALALAMLSEDEFSNYFLYYVELDKNLTLRRKLTLVEEDFEGDFSIGLQGGFPLLVWTAEGKSFLDEVYLVRLGVGEDEVKPKRLSKDDEEFSWHPQLVATGPPYEVVWVEHAYEPDGWVIYTEGEGQRDLTEQRLKIDQNLEIIPIVTLAMVPLLVGLFVIVGTDSEYNLKVHEVSNPEVFLILNKWRLLYPATLFVTFGLGTFGFMFWEIGGQGPPLVFGVAFPGSLILNLVVTTYLWQGVRELRAEAAPLETSQKLLSLGWLGFATLITALLWVHRQPGALTTLFPVLLWSGLILASFITTMGVLAMAVGLTNSPRLYLLGSGYLAITIRLLLSSVRYTGTVVHLERDGVTSLFAGSIDTFMYAMILAIIIYFLFDQKVKISEMLGIGWIDQGVIDRLVSRELRVSLLLQIGIGGMFFSIFLIFPAEPQTFLFLMDDVNFALIFASMGFFLIGMNLKQMSQKMDLLARQEEIEEEGPLNWLQKTFLIPLTTSMGAIIVAMVSPALALAIVIYAGYQTLRMGQMMRRDFLAVLTFKEGKGGELEAELPAQERVGQVRLIRPRLWPFFRRALNNAEYLLVGGVVLMAILVKLEVEVGLSGLWMGVALVLLGLVLLLGLFLTLLAIGSFATSLDQHQLDVETMLGGIGYVGEVWLVGSALGLALLAGPLVGVGVMMVLFGLVWYKLLFLEPRLEQTLNSLPPEKLTMDFEALKKKCALLDLKWEDFVHPQELRRVEGVMARRAAQVAAVETRFTRHQDTLG